MASDGNNPTSLPPLLKLPTEIRLMIFQPLLTVSSTIILADLYESQVVGTEGIIRSQKRSYLNEPGGKGLILTCKVISDEALLLLYQSNTFDPTRHFTIYGCSPADRYCYKCQSWYQFLRPERTKEICCLSNTAPCLYALEKTYQFFSTIGSNANRIRRLSLNRFWPEIEAAFRDHLLPNVVEVVTPQVRYRHINDENCQGLLEDDFKDRTVGDWPHLYRSMEKVIHLSNEIFENHAKLRHLAYIDPITRSTFGSRVQFRLLSPDEELLAQVSRICLTRRS